MTDLDKPVKRRSGFSVRDAGKMRRLVVTLYPHGFIGLRPEKTRREETIGLHAAYDAAVKMRVARERAERAAARKARRPV